MIDRRDLMIDQLSVARVAGKPIQPAFGRYPASSSAIGDRRSVAGCDRALARFVERGCKQGELLNRCVGAWIGIARQFGKRNHKVVEETRFPAGSRALEVGRASCRERGGQYV